MTKYLKSQVDHSTPSHNLPNQGVNHRYIGEKTRNEKNAQKIIIKEMIFNS